MPNISYKIHKEGKNLTDIIDIIIIITFISPYSHQ